METLSSEEKALVSFTVSISVRCPKCKRTIAHPATKKDNWTLGQINHTGRVSCGNCSQYVWIPAFDPMKEIW